MVLWFWHLVDDVLVHAVFEEAVEDALLEALHFALEYLHLPLELGDCVGFQGELCF